jgi:PHD/YefM family antitoxin component YafN of YafNO toxin-antitoxin module
LADRLGAILDEAQRRPVVIRRQDRDIAVVLSMAEYERLIEDRPAATLAPAAAAADRGSS